MLPHADPVHKISIVARGMAGGYTKQLHTEDRHIYTRSQLMDMLATYLGGRAAEEMIFDEVSTGGQNDLEQVTTYARRMVKEWGMSNKLGPRTFGRREELVFLGRTVDEQKDYGDKVADTIDEEVNKIIQNAHRTAKRLLTENKPKLKRIAEELITKETLEGDELEALFNEPAAADVPEATATPAPTAATAKTKTKPVSKKTRVSAPTYPETSPGLHLIRGESGSPKPSGGRDCLSK